MKFTVTMKCPDALEESIRVAIDESFASEGLLDDDECEAVRDIRYDTVRALCVRKWFKYGEYLEVEVDTEAETCVVQTKR